MLKDKIRSLKFFTAMLWIMEAILIVLFIVMTTDQNKIAMMCVGIVGLITLGLIFSFKNMKKKLEKRMQEERWMPMERCFFADERSIKIAEKS